MIVYTAICWMVFIQFAFFSLDSVGAKQPLAAAETSVRMTFPATEQSDSGTDPQTALLFSQDLCSFPLVIFTRTDSSFIGAVTDLRGRTVSVEKGAVSYSFLKENAPEIEIKEVNGGIEALRELSAGHVNAHIGSLAVGSYLIMNHGLPNLKVAAPMDFPPTPLSIAVGKDHAEFAAVIGKAIDTIAPEEHTRIRQKWLAVHYEQGIRTAAVVKWVLADEGTGLPIDDCRIKGTQSPCCRPPRPHRPFTGALAHAIGRHSGDGIRRGEETAR